MKDFTNVAGGVTSFAGGVNLKCFYQLHMKAAFWSDGNELELQNWVAKPVDPERNFCVYLNGTDGMWYLTDCSDQRFYTCKVSNGNIMSSHLMIVQPEVLLLE